MTEPASAGAAPTPAQGVSKTSATHLLRHLLLTLAFCLAVASIQQLFMPSTRFEVHLVYSLATGITVWGGIEAGRLWLTRESDDDWPRGFMGIGLVAVSIAIGYLVGSLVGDWWFGWSSWRQGRGEIVSGMLVTLLASSVAVGYFYLQGRGSALEAHAEAAKAQAAESRLRLLQSQLDPHMLFNTLANLRALIALDPPRATLMLDRLNDYLRATLDASRQTMHPLSREFALIEDYLELMAVRMGARLRYSLDLPSELRQRPVPTLLLQPLVENSIRHGLEPRAEGGEIHVGARLEGAALLIEVGDDGVGLSDPAPAAAGFPAALPDAARAGGFGLSQLRERLETAYGRRASLRVARRDAAARGLRVTVRIEG